MLEVLESAMEARTTLHDEVVERLVFKFEEKAFVIENALHKTSVATEVESTKIALIINMFLSYMGE